jgi:hypothetical protein
MINQTYRALVLTVISAFAMPALADDCATAAKNAMSNSGHTPKSSVTSVTDSQGKKFTTRTVQTVTDKYAQTPDGKWYSMGVAIKDLIDDVNTTKVTCRRSGADTVNGEQAATYEIQMTADAITADSKIWVSSKNLILKSEGSTEGTHYVTVYDYAHVTPPANAAPMGGK